ncbi:MAG TPA: aromatic-ring-hydroxylating dioxygenase subunit beta [Chloroflexota bacterium]|nr:aromatic-ring-hydroxylating dioxygenase subunit beta [Chloroflexota bacterium]
MDVSQEREIERFIYREAALLDDRQFDSWLNLFTEDAIYWIPNVSADSDPRREAFVVHDDRQELALRVARLQHPAALTQNPPPRIRHFVGNVVAQTVNQGECLVTSNQLVYYTKGEREELYPGAHEHLLRHDGQGWRIVRKKVYLLTNNRPLASVPLL